MGRRPRLSAADAAWVRIDAPRNHMVITAVLTFAAPLELEKLKQVITSRLLTLAQFRSRVVRPSRLRRQVWDPDPHFELEAHLRPARLLPPDDPQALRELVGQLMSRPLDLARAPWEILVLEGYRGGTVLLVRLHHCIADGMALVRVLLSLTDGPEEQPSSHPPPPRVSWPGKLARSGRHFLGSILELVRLLLMPSDPPSSLKKELSGVKRAAWSRPIPLERVQALSHRLGVTVNDLLTGALSGALREVLELPLPSRLRAVIPVDLRPGRTPRELGNYFGLIFLRLPVERTEPLRRLAEVQRRMAKLKGSPQAIAALQIVRLVGAFLPAVARLVVWLLGRKGTLVLTNVIGPRQPRQLAGVAISELIFWVPQSASLGVGASLLSYAGQVRIAVAADSRLLPDPARLVEGIEREVEKLEALALHNPPNRSGQ